MAEAVNYLLANGADPNAMNNVRALPTVLLRDSRLRHSKVICLTRLDAEYRARAGCPTATFIDVR